MMETLQRTRDWELDGIAEIPTRFSNTSRGDGTTEKFVLVKNAAFIQSNGSIIVDPRC